MQGTPIENSLHFCLTDDLRSGKNEVSRDALRVQFGGRTFPLARGQLSDSPLDLVQLGKCEVWQVGGDFARAHRSRMARCGCGVKCAAALRSRCEGIAFGSALATFPA